MKEFSPQEKANRIARKEALSGRVGPYLVTIDGATFYYNLWWFDYWHRSKEEYELAIEKEQPEAEGT